MFFTWQGDEILSEGAWQANACPAEVTPSAASPACCPCLTPAQNSGTGPKLQDFHPHDRDRPAARPFDDPHQTPPPRPAAAAAHQHHAVQPPQPPPEPSLELPSSLSTSDLE